MKPGHFLLFSAPGWCAYLMDISAPQHSLTEKYVHFSKCEGKKKQKTKRHKQTVHGSTWERSCAAADTGNLILELSSSTACELQTFLAHGSRHPSLRFSSCPFCFYKFLFHSHFCFTNILSQSFETPPPPHPQFSFLTHFSIVVNWSESN